MARLRVLTTNGIEDLELEEFGFPLDGGQPLERDSGIPCRQPRIAHALRGCADQGSPAAHGSGRDRAAGAARRARCRRHLRGAVMRADPIGNDVRKLRRARRLGPGAACVICGEANRDQLKRMSRSLLERHHLAGRANDPELTVVVCLNHHARLSEAQRDSGVDLHEDPSRPRRSGRPHCFVVSLTSPNWQHLSCAATPTHSRPTPSTSTRPTTRRRHERVLAGRRSGLYRAADP